ncbi:MAG: hypothetical protein ACOX5R_06295 [bacterium]
MIYLVLIVLILGIYLYSLPFFDAPISRGVRVFLSLCRLAFLCFLLYLLTLPKTEEVEKEVISPTLYIALDDSQSMSFAVQPQNNQTEPSRWEIMRQQLQDGGIIRSWQNEGFQLRFGVFSYLSAEELRAAPWAATFPAWSEPNFPYTDISTVISTFEQSQAPQENAFLLLFTDGQHNRGKNPVASAAAIINATEGELELIDKRIFTFGIGSISTIYDVIVDAVNIPATLRAGNGFPLQAHILLRGTIPPQPLTLQVQGEKSDGTQVFQEEQTLQISPGQSEASVSFQVPPLEEGEYRFTVRIPPISGELLEENNTQSRGVRVQQARDEILLLTSAPDWELKFLKRALENQETIDIDAFYRHNLGLTPLGDRVWVQQKAGEPLPEEELETPSNMEDITVQLNQWSVLILHNFAFIPDDVDFAHALREYIGNGGGVILVPGPLNTGNLPPVLRDALPSVLAANLTPSQLLLSPRIDQSFLAGDSSLEGISLPPLFPYYRSVNPSVSGQVLMSAVTSHGEQMPMIEIHRYGLGRIIRLYTNSFWRWNMLTGNDILTPFWISLLYESNPNLDLKTGQLVTDGFLYEIQEPVQITYVTAPQVQNATTSGMAIQVIGPAGEETLWLSQGDAPNRFTGQYTPVEAGDYIFSHSAQNASAAIHVEANPLETYNLQQNVQLLQAIARQTGGDYANLPAWKTLAQNIPAPRKAVEQSRIFFLGEKWWVASLLILLLALEWFMRWRKGLP